MKLADVREEFEKYIVISDKWALDVVMATFVGNELIDRDPLWTIIIGPSSGGKTTLIAPCVSLPHTYFVDDLTEKTLLSGYKVKGKEASLLKKIGSGMIAISDFTSILAKNPISRGEILTQLKLVYDGKLTKETGTGSIAWTGKIGFLGASTPDIYSYLENSRSMGERFLYYWFEQPTSQEIMDKQASHNLSSRQITETLQELYKSYFEDITLFVRANNIELKMDAEQKKRVNDAAVFCVNGKATIHTDFKTGRPDAIPNISGVGRDAKIFDTLLHALQVMDCFEHNDPSRPVSDEMVAIVEKCAYSSINRERRKILEILVKRESSMTSSQIGASEGLGLDKEGVNKYLAPLHAVGMISKRATGGAHTWFVENPEVLAFVSRVGPTVIDKTVAQSIEVEEDGDDEQVMSEDDQKLWGSV